ncbi:testis-expressed protein 9-like [Cloeon dipterum]|uniref:testis-expressed protein 9-like n=1 Tax=Cloeon dipterum TaxID=197152 RepID=UPI00322004DD
MEGNMLKRDEQQFQINEELELRTRLLMKEAECILKETPGQLKKDNAQLSDIASKIYIPITVGVENNDLPKKSAEKPLTSHNDFHSEPELRFLRAKVNILAAEIEKLKDDGIKKVDELKLMDSNLQSLKEERNKATQQLSVAENKVARAQNALSEQSNSMKMLESIKTKLTHDLAAAKKEAKLSSQHATTMELRMNRALEEVENLKTALHMRRGQDKEEQEMQRKTLESQTAMIQKLERQQAELVMAFRRQLVLCHNLQRQKELLAATAALNIADSKFTDMLQGTRSNQ